MARRAARRVAIRMAVPMAILIDFELIRDDSLEVEYTFGHPTMDRRLVIEKESGAGRPLDGNPDHEYAAVLVKISRYRRERDTWPNRGSYQA
jgi:hypothetical protein